MWLPSPSPRISLPVHLRFYPLSAICNTGDPGLFPGSTRSLREGKGYPLQYSCLENSMDRRAWQATVHVVTKSWTCLSDLDRYVYQCTYLSTYLPAHPPIIHVCVSCLWCFSAALADAPLCPCLHPSLMPLCPLEGHLSPSVVSRRSGSLQMVPVFVNGIQLRQREVTGTCAQTGGALSDQASWTSRNAAGKVEAAVCGSKGRGAPALHCVQEL